MIKKLVKICAVFLVMLISFSNIYVAGAAPSQDKNTLDRTLIPLGFTAGVKLKSDGLIVTGITKVNAEDGIFAPASDGGLLEGDIITHANSHKLDSSSDLQNRINESNGKELELDIRRDGKPARLKLTPAMDSDGSFKLGLLLRDNLAGIGTLTYYDPDTKLFGALGHGINDIDTLQLMPLSKGSVIRSNVTQIKKGHPGTPGELVGEFNPQEEIGNILANSDGGIFGTLSRPEVAMGTPIPVAASSEIKVGSATILSNISGDSVESFNVEIARVFPGESGTTRNMMLEVKDERLLDKTGGIVQGMSGSPIIQNGKLVGAVTHVLVNNPQRGYGIFIENMLEISNNLNNKVYNNKKSA